MQHLTKLKNMRPLNTPQSRPDRHLHIELERFLSVCLVRRCDEGAVSPLRLSPDRGRSAGLSGRAAPGSTERTGDILSGCHRLFWCVRERHVIVLVSQHVKTSCWHLFAFFICTLNCFCSWVHACWGGQHRKSNLLQERWGKRQVGWCASTPHGLVAWKSPKDKQTSDLITNPIMWASYLRCEQHR